MPFAAINGIALYYESHGSGPAIVFAHGAGGNHLSWWQQIPVFSQRFRCITYDGLGNGKSDRPEDTSAYTLDNYLSDALAVMDALKVEQAILIGLSFGGLLASILAAHHPERDGDDELTTPPPLNPALPSNGPERLHFPLRHPAADHHVALHEQHRDLAAQPL